MRSKQTLELRIPSVLGFEKLAMDFAAAVAKMMNVPEDRVEDLKTAVAEACLNAIEHGNKLDASMKVGIRLTVGDSKLQVAVRDQGQGIGEVATPDIESKMAGEARPRGWGIFLIQSLMDEVKFESTAEGGNQVKMIIHLGKLAADPPPTDSAK
jgi:serine/threonine-protein kinase RsbW